MYSSKCIVHPMWIKQESAITNCINKYRHASQEVLTHTVKARHFVKANQCLSTCYAKYKDIHPHNTVCYCSVWSKWICYMDCPTKWHNEEQKLNCFCIFSPWHLYSLTCYIFKVLDDVSKLSWLLKLLFADLFVRPCTCYHVHVMNGIKNDTVKCYHYYISNY